MSSYRITIQEEAAPVAIAARSSTTGAMVIRAPKGSIEPFKISRGETSLLLKKYGYPSASYPDIQEALDYVEDSDLWVSSPYDEAGALYGGVAITTAGSIPLTVGVADPDLFDFSAVEWKEEIGEGDGIVDNFVIALTQPYTNLSLSKIIVGSTEITDVAVTDAEPEVITGTGITSGTLTRATGTIDITLDDIPADGVKVYAVYETDMSAQAYFVLFSSSPQVNDEQVIASYNTDLSQFEWDFYIQNNKGVMKLIDSYKGSNIPNTFNASNENIFMEVYLADNPYFKVKANDTLTYTAMTADTTGVAFDGGARSAVYTAAEYQAGWDYFKSVNTYPAKVFIDVIGDDSIPALFATLRTSYQKYSRYLCILPDSENAAASIATKASYSIDNRGLSFYSNWVYISENYNNTKFWSSRMGKTAIKHAEIIRQVYGGLAPSWTNENGLGGQLSGTIIKTRYDYSEADLQLLDTAGINPRIFHPSYGLMITSQKTGATPTVLTDFSYIAHSGAADYLIENVVNQCLTPQLTKLNDNRHRTKVKAMADTIADPLEGLSILSAVFNKCDSENNNATVLNARQFVLTTAVQFTPTSEFIVYNFRSAPQGVSVEEVAAL